MVHALIAAATFVLAGPGSAARIQDPDVTKPPVVVHDAGGFHARQLSGPPAIDGREWIAVTMHDEPLPATLRSPDRRYAVTLEETDEDTGDFTRYKVLFQRGRRTPVRIGDGFSGWVYITPDSRFVFTEPLYVLDVREWKQYALFETLEIPNYTSIEAISADGRRLLTSRRDCVMDCHDEPVVQYFELTLPGPPGQG